MRLFFALFEIKTLVTSHSFEQNQNAPAQNIFGTQAVFAPFNEPKSKPLFSQNSFIMMLKSSSLFGILALAAFSFTACKEESRTEILTSGNWKISAQTVDPGFVIVTPAGLSESSDYYKDVFQDCQKDDYLTFYEDFNAVRNEGPSKCNISDAQTASGTWTFKTGDAQLELILDGKTRIFAIQSFDDAKIVATHSETILNKNYTFTTTLIRP